MLQIIQILTCKKLELFVLEKRQFTFVDGQSFLAQVLHFQFMANHISQKIGNEIATTPCNLCCFLVLVNKLIRMGKKDKLTAIANCFPKQHSTRKAIHARSDPHKSADIGKSHR